MEEGDRMTKKNVGKERSTGEMGNFEGVGENSNGEKKGE